MYFAFFIGNSSYFYCYPYFCVALLLKSQSCSLFEAVFETIIFHIPDTIFLCFIVICTLILTVLLFSTAITFTHHKTIFQQTNQFSFGL